MFLNPEIDAHYYEFLQGQYDVKLSLESAIKKLIDSIAEKHGVKNIQDFMCQYIRELATLIQWGKNETN